MDAGRVAVRSTLAITNGPDFILIGHAYRVCRIWFNRDQSEDSQVVPIIPDTAYTTGMTNRQTGSKDNNSDSPLVIASPVRSQIRLRCYTFAS